MSKRKVRRDKARQAQMSMQELFANLIPRQQTAVNEKIIWAVNKLTNMNGHGPIGTKGIIESRAKQMILDMPIVGFKTASQRFRNAIHRQKTTGELCNET